MSRIKLTKEECINLIAETYETYKHHTLDHLPSYDLAEVDSLMSDLVNLLTENK